MFEFGGCCFVLMGLCMVIEDGWEGQICLCSGLVWKYGVIVFNVLGMIDLDYCGEVKVLFVNVG